MAGVRCATRKDSLPLARVICPGGGSGGGEACRCLGGSGEGVRGAEALKVQAVVGRVGVLEALSGKVQAYFGRE